MSRRVRIGTCAGAADAAFVRSVFAAHDLPVVIGAETAGMPGLTGGFLAPDIWVDEDDAEEAAALLRDIRDSEPVPDGDDGDDGDDTAGGGDPGAWAGSGAPVHPDIASHDRDLADGGAAYVGTAVEARTRTADSVQLRIDRRRRTAVALLLGVCITFGTAHMFTRAWLRGIALAGLEGLGFRYLLAGDPLGGWIVAAAIAYDLVGALWRIRAAPRSTLPIAQLRSG